jgi:hypothetical protein
VSPRRSGKPRDPKEEVVERAEAIEWVKERIKSWSVEPPDPEAEIEASEAANGNALDLAREARESLVRVERPAPPPPPPLPVTPRTPARRDSLARRPAAPAAPVEQNGRSQPAAAPKASAEEPPTGSATDSEAPPKRRGRPRGRASRRQVHFHVDQIEDQLLLAASRQFGSQQKGFIAGLRALQEVELLREEIRRLTAECERQRQLLENAAALFKG